MQVSLYNNNQYIIRFYWKDGEGKRRNISLTKKEWTKTAYNAKFFRNSIAPIEMAKRIQELEKEEKAEETRKSSITSYAEEFLSLSETMVRRGTNVQKRIHLMKHVIPFFRSDIPVNEALTVKTVTDFRIHLSQDVALCQRVKNSVFSTMRQFVDYLVSHKAIDGAEGYAMKSSLVGFKKSDEVTDDDDVGENFWTKEEYDRFMATFDENDPYRFIYYISFWCATRIGETLGLKFSDFNEDEGTLTISRQFTMGGKISMPKTSSSRATISIPSHIFTNLKKFYVLVKAESTDNFLFFPTGHISRTTINNVLVRHAKKAGLKPITPHGFRHSCASNLLRNGFDYMDVSKYLRHGSPDITLKVYSHWIEKKGGKKISMMEE